MPSGTGAYGLHSHFNPLYGYCMSTSCDTNLTLCCLLSLLMHLVTSFLISFKISVSAASFYHSSFPAFVWLPLALHRLAAAASCVVVGMLRACFMNVIVSCCSFQYIHDRYETIGLRLAAAASCKVSRRFVTKRDC